MGKKYTSRVPLVETADQRIKIARLSIACACCVFSTTDGEDVVVKKEHVEFVVNFLDRIYSSKSMGYDKLSEQERINTDSSDANISKLRAMFTLLPLQDFNETIKTLYQLPYFNRFTLEDYTGLPRDDLRLLLKFLTNNHLVERVRSDYRRMPIGTEFLEHCIEKPFTPDEIDRARKNYYSATEY
jgi:hypothetical protein